MLTAERPCNPSSSTAECGTDTDGVLHRAEQLHWELSLGLCFTLHRVHERHMGDVLNTSLVDRARARTRPAGPCGHGRLRAALPCPACTVRRQPPAQRRSRRARRPRPSPRRTASGGSRTRATSLAGQGGGVRRPGPRPRPRARRGAPSSGRPRCPAGRAAPPHPRGRTRRLRRGAGLRAETRARGAPGRGQRPPAPGRGCRSAPAAREARRAAEQARSCARPPCAPLQAAPVPRADAGGPRRGVSSRAPLPAQQARGCGHRGAPGRPLAPRLGARQAALRSGRPHGHWLPPLRPAARRQPGAAGGR